MKQFSVAFEFLEDESEALKPFWLKYLIFLFKLIANWRVWELVPSKVSGGPVKYQASMATLWEEITSPSKCLERGERAHEQGSKGLPTPLNTDQALQTKIVDGTPHLWRQHWNMCCFYFFHNLNMTL